MNNDSNIFVFEEVDSSRKIKYAVQGESIQDAYNKLKNNVEDDTREFNFSGIYMPVEEYNNQKNRIKDRIDANNYIVENFLYDKKSLYTNCLVEILENSENGDVSVGWYKTEETEEIKDD